MMGQRSAARAQEGSVNRAARFGFHHDAAVEP